ncbi:MAG TPA: hypothetical protein VNH11_33730 [Pirellulales bacterium]|nr:hypothetical protein [Pirellulales bacterium]
MMSEAPLGDVRSERLKYADDLARLINCPPSDARQCQPSRVFRFVHDLITDERNFIPPAKLNPARKFKDDEERCSAHALSMFISQPQAVSFFTGLKRRYPNIHKVLGANLSAGTLADTDGLATTPDSRGHFDLLSPGRLTFPKHFVSFRR